MMHLYLTFFFIVNTLSIDIDEFDFISKTPIIQVAQKVFKTNLKNDLVKTLKGKSDKLSTVHEVIFAVRQVSKLKISKNQPMTNEIIKIKYAGKS